MDTKPLHFLLVEDDDAHAELVTMALEENRVSNTIDRVADGEQAIEYLEQRGEYREARRPDVVLLDLKLPRVDGHEVLHHMKHNENLCLIPTVVLTTSYSEADKARAYYNHANSYLVKPIDFAKFHDMIRDLNLYWSVWNQPPQLAQPGGS